MNYNAGAQRAPASCYNKTMVFAKKQFGQNFLHNETILKTIIQAGDVQVGDAVLEIGPGRGALTEHLLAAGATVIAIEKDQEMVDVLLETFPAETGKKGTLGLSQGDVLKMSIGSLFEKVDSYKVIANIPYYITGAILEHIFSQEKLPSVAVLMVQKEVAERIARNEKKESILSISVKAYGKPEYIKTVGRGNFAPAPGVDSAILRVSNISKELFINNRISERDFFSVLKQGMGQKRKTLVNNLKSLVDQEKLIAYLVSRNYSEKIRPEDLVLEDWGAITKFKK